MIHTRHIRHDWRTFNDRQDQNTVKTLCNVKTSVRLAGIPGVTEQNLLVHKGDGTSAFGWCIICAYNGHLQALGDELDHADPRIDALYQEFMRITGPLHQAQLNKMRSLVTKSR